MKINEYKVVKSNYGLPNLKIAHTYKTEIEDYTSYENMAAMLDEIFYLSYLNEEYMYVVSLDSGSHVKGVYELAHGCHKFVTAYSKELFTFLLLSGATQFVVVHNHPSGILEPSEQDKKWTASMQMSANILHIDFLEHIIVTEDGFITIKDGNNAYDCINWDEIIL